MKISYNELRELKHRLPEGSVSRIANELNVEPQTIRNYFGADKYSEGETVDRHIQPGPNGGIVHLKDERIVNLARKIITEKGAGQVHA